MKLPSLLDWPIEHLLNGASRTRHRRAREYSPTQPTPMLHMRIEESSGTVVTAAMLSRAKKAGILMPKVHLPVQRTHSMDSRGPYRKSPDTVGEFTSAVDRPVLG
jgi:hypothetical protein